MIAAASWLLRRPGCDLAVGRRAGLCGELAYSPPLWTLALVSRRAMPRRICFEVEDRSLNVVEDN